ncbi:ABC transporter ATP-binding protein [Ornithinimicrobium pratense]|uniref:ABC transporter ATP-binding protein n=1 Tax=Ornithinimicrobium pratense TaxID=2593973 RepID=A0A5J6V7E6_9MICO|nr:ABC transporter ATP-binding protein [Ornithinimicrobium pratense]QFG69477.1 ABC transporter ATP-binding protein [Ornithinimicrobium pratense]
MSLDARTASAVPGSSDALVSLRSVSKHYRISQTKALRTRHATLRAVDDVSLDIARGETVGLVGESGSGKSTLGRLAVRLLEVTEGTVRFDGQDITHLPDRRLRPLRRNMQVVFQDPVGSIDPRMTVGEVIGEPLAVFEGLRGRARRERVAELLELVGLDPARADSGGKSLSGGQRQRIGIARAIAVNPAFILADEPVSALDVSVQAQISNLLVELRERLSLTYLFIGHGLPIVRQVAQRVAVMYLGRIVEIGPTDALFANPLHPYTTALISASPEAGTADALRERVVLAGDPPSATDLPSGCRFRTRCPIARDICAEVPPPRIDLKATHSAECHFPGEFS